MQLVHSGSKGHGLCIACSECIESRKVYVSRRVQEVSVDYGVPFLFAMLLASRQAAFLRGFEWLHAVAYHLFNLVLGRFIKFYFQFGYSTSPWAPI